MNNLVNGFEAILLNVHRRLPHMPRSIVDWMGANLWWLVIAVIVLLFYSITQAMPLLTLSILGFQFSEVSKPSIGQLFSAEAIVSIVFFVAIVGLLIKSIGSLNSRKKRGWDLLFSAVLVYILSEIATSIIRSDFAYLFMSALTSVAVLYILFELRDYFLPRIVMPDGTLHARETINSDNLE
jgi:hypothetical protein